MAGASSVKQALAWPLTVTLCLSMNSVQLALEIKPLGEVKTSRRWHILLSRYQCTKATSISRLGRRTGRLAAGAGLKRVFPFYFTNVSALQGFERILTIRNGEVLEL